VVTEELGGFFDMNIGVNYTYSSMFGAFLRAQNIFNKEYNYWQNYPVRGFNFMLGLNVNL
jgi:outer membrane receptor protein involved in Fe transport